MTDGICNHTIRISKGVRRVKQASVHDFPNIEECKLFEGIKCDKCRECENEMKEWLIFKKELEE